jgi:hypothetical protein
MEADAQLQMKRWVETWQNAGIALDQIRQQDIRNADTFKAMRVFTGAVSSHLAKAQPRVTSGLVEQQAWFQKLARR